MQSGQMLRNHQAALGLSHQQHGHASSSGFSSDATQRGGIAVSELEVMSYVE